MISTMPPKKKPRCDISGLKNQPKLTTDSSQINEPMSCASDNRVLPDPLIDNDADDEEWTPNLPINSNKLMWNDEESEDNFDSKNEEDFLDKIVEEEKPGVNPRKYRNKGCYVALWNTTHFQNIVAEFKRWQWNLPVGRKKGSSKLLKSVASMWVTFVPNAHLSVHLRTMIAAWHAFSVNKMTSLTKFPCLKVWFRRLAMNAFSFPSFTANIHCELNPIKMVSPIFPH